MDIILLIIIFAIGCVRIKMQDRSAEHTGPQTETAESLQSIPVGNNLMLKRENGAFMRIIKELKLG